MAPCKSLPWWVLVQDHVQKQVTRLTSASNFLQNIPAIFFVLVLGPWSDTYGRKFLIIFPLLGFILLDVIIIINVVFFEVLRMKEKGKNTFFIDFIEAGNWLFTFGMSPRPDWRIFVSFHGPDLFHCWHNNQEGEDYASSLFGRYVCYWIGHWFSVSASSISKVIWAFRTLIIVYPFHFIFLSQLGILWRLWHFGCSFHPRHRLQFYSKRVQKEYFQGSQSELLQDL